MLSLTLALTLLAPDAKALNKAADALLSPKDYTFRFVRLESFTYNGKPATATWGMGVLRRKKSGIMDDTGYADCRLLIKGDGLEKEVKVPNHKLFLPQLDEALTELKKDSKTGDFHAQEPGDYYSPDLGLICRGPMLPSLFSAKAEKGKLGFPLESEVKGPVRARFYLTEERAASQREMDALARKLGFNESKSLSEGNPSTYATFAIGTRELVPSHTSVFTTAKYTFVAIGIAQGKDSVAPQFELRAAP